MSDRVDEDWMRAAISQAEAAIAAGQTPFGAVLVRGGEVLTAAHNQVWARLDPTAHAEITLLRCAGEQLGGIAFPDCTLYSTCEPCPMCMAAIHWARIPRVVYGAGIDDAAAAGFHELPVPAAQLLALGQSQVQLTAGCLADECRELFARWKSAGLSPAY